MPPREELRERWRTGDIARMVGERFPRLGGEVSFFLLAEWLSACRVVLGCGDCVYDDD